MHNCLGRSQVWKEQYVLNGNVQEWSAAEGRPIVRKRIWLKGVLYDAERKVSW